jgi:hypothetical protein
MPRMYFFVCGGVSLIFTTVLSAQVQTRQQSVQPVSYQLKEQHLDYDQLPVNSVSKKVNDQYSVAYNSGLSTWKQEVLKMNSLKPAVKQLSYMDKATMLKTENNNWWIDPSKSHNGGFIKGTSIKVNNN